MSLPYHLALVPLLLIGATGAVSAVEEHNDGIPRAVAQALVGTAGFEPGIAAEWRFGDPHLLVRPELFLNEDNRLGFAASIGWELEFLNLPERQALTIGPRLVYHNSDEYGWGIDALVIWHFDLVPSQRGRHFLEAIGAVGAIEEEKGGDDDVEPGFSVGIGYGFQF